jgi:hypothetical protein
MLTAPPIAHTTARWAHALAAACLVGAAVPASASNLLVNGGFENPTLGYQLVPGGNSTAIAGWTAVLSGVEHYNSPAYGLGPAADGVMVVDLANYTYSAGGIEQAVPTVAGQSYDVSFFAGNTRSSGRTGTGIVKVTIDGATTLDFNTPVATSGLTVWEQRSFSFVAGDSSTTLRFWNNQNANAYFALIDGVGAQAAPVPEPQTWALMLAGLLATARVARRRR